MGYSADKINEFLEEKLNGYQDFIFKINFSNNLIIYQPNT